MIHYVAHIPSVFKKAVSSFRKSRERRSTWIFDRTNRKIRQYASGYFLSSLATTNMATFRDDLLEQYSDAEIARFIRESPTLKSHSGIVILSDAYLAKLYYDFSDQDAIAAMELAGSVGVRAPRGRRSVVVDRLTWCIMDRIEGQTLEELWPSIGWLQAICLAFQLRGFVQKLRSLTSPTAGSLATGLCRSFWLEDRFRLPPRTTKDSINAFINFWMEFISLRREINKSEAEHRQLPKQHLSPIHTLVFTHHDLAARNIILHPSGKLWVIDWDYAGWYPRCFEYAAMHFSINPQGWDRWACIRWNLFCWLAGGFYDQDARVLNTVQFRFTRFPVARRFNMKASGFASASQFKERERSDSERSDSL